MRRFSPLILLALLLLTLTPRASAASPNGDVSAAVYDYQAQRYGSDARLPVVSLRLNGKPISGEMPGVVYGNRTLAPLRLLAEGLGAEVVWVQDKAQVYVIREDTTFLFTLGSPIVYVDGKARELPDKVPATMVRYEDQGHTMVPLRFFSETLGCQVDWEQKSYTAAVSEDHYIADSLLEKLDRPVEAEKYVIALDAGHGGSASGAYYEKTAEKDLTLSMTLKLERILRALGYQTVLTRWGDTYMDLYERAEIANEAGADIFVSVHCNAAEKNPDFQGLYVYHYPGSQVGAALAQSIQTAACDFTGAVDREIDKANFVVLRETTMPAVLVETGFMTCHEELERLKDPAYQTKMALGMAQGVIQYLNPQK